MNNLVKSYQFYENQFFSYKIVVIHHSNVSIKRPNPAFKISFQSLKFRISRLTNSVQGSDHVTRCNKVNDHVMKTYCPECHFS